ncbi:hypothetical protein J2797_000773 [Paraburkholderia terricola]|nr:hypothetical protein [Paraburkholderia terricola]
MSSNSNRAGNQVPRPRHSTVERMAKLTREVQRNFSREPRAGEPRRESRAAARRRPSHKLTNAYTVRARRLRYAAVGGAARRASYGRRGDVDRDRKESRCATSRLRQGVRRYSRCGGLPADWRVWTRAHSQLCRRKAGHGRALVPVSLQSYRLPPVQSPVDAHSAKPLPSCCSLRGAATGYLNAYTTR